MSSEYWLSDAEWEVVEPLIPMNRCGVKPRHNRRIISGIVHVLRVGCRWCDCPSLYGPSTTVYNRFNRWSKAGIWQGMFDRLMALDQSETQSIDSTTSKAHRCSAGGKGGRRRRRSGAAAAAGPRRSMPSSTLSAA